MSLSKRALISIVAAGVAVSILGGFSLAYMSSPSDGESDNEKNGGNGNVSVGNGDIIESCQPPDNPDLLPMKRNDVVSISDSKTIGFPIGTEEVPSIRPLILADPAEKVSFRFTAKHGGEVRSLGINLLQSTGNETAFRVGLQENEGGRPSGEWLTFPENGNTRADLRGYITIDLKEPVTLVRDKVYHLVIETTEPAVDASNQLRIRVYDIYAPFQPLNDEQDVPWSDPAMNALFYDGSSWKTSNVWPIFVLNFSDGKAIGQPYSLAAQWVIYGQRHTGQEIVPSVNLVVEKFGFSVALDGEPDDNLCYEIRDSSNKILTHGLFAAPDDLVLHPDFVEVRLDPPLTFEKDKPYKIVLFSHGSTPENPYHLYGHEFSYDATIGYGGLKHILTTSYDSGTKWNRWEDADTIFALTLR